MDTQRLSEIKERLHEANNGPIWDTLDAEQIVVVDAPWLLDEVERLRKALEIISKDYWTATGRQNHPTSSAEIAMKALTHTDGGKV